MAWPVTFNGRTYTSNDFLNSSYVNGLPDLMQDAATHFSNGYVGSSTTSLTVGTGNKTLTVEPNKLFGIGQPVVIADAAAPSTNYMDGRITAWNALTGSMTVAVAAIGGSGTKTAWTVTIGGARINTGNIPAPVNEGGTGSTTAGGALTNLGLSAVAQTLVAQTTQTLMRTTGLGVTTAGDAIIVAASAAAQRTALGSGATGDSIFTAATAAAARTILGSGATGDAIFQASTAASARSTLAVGENHGAGSASTPSMAFAADPNTGIYNPTADALGLVAGGVEGARVTNSGIDVVDGSAASPSFGFINETNTGFYRVSAGIIGLSIGGVQYASLSATLMKIGGVEFTGPMRHMITNYGLSNSPGDTANDIDIAPGVATADSFDFVIRNTATLTKRLDASWAAGSGNGGLDTGSKAVSTWYYLFVIFNPTTLAMDALFSTNAFAPTLPSGYSKKRRIGAIRTDSSGNILQFIQTGDVFTWINETTDFNSSSLGTAAQTFTATIPQAFRTMWMGRASARAATNNVAHINSTFAPDLSLTVDSANISFPGGSPPGKYQGMLLSAGGLRIKSGVASTTAVVITEGYIDMRGKEQGTG